MNALLIRNVEVNGRAGQDVVIDDGCIAAVGPNLTGKGAQIDGGGGALIPGLVDHHIHILATAARRQSCTLDDIADIAGLKNRIVCAVRGCPRGQWLRATGLAPHLADDLTSDLLSRWTPDHPVRIQDQSGAMWILNAQALDRIAHGELDPGVELDEAGRPTGRLWRADTWLRSRLGDGAPSLASLGAELASYGITALTDASVTNDAGSARILGDAVRTGELPQRLTMMSGGPLAIPQDKAFNIGPVKILLDDRDLPPLETVAGAIESARQQDRRVAVHCVTAGELAITLAAFMEAGAGYGDRIEHGGIIPAEAIETLRAMRLTVVTQPGFIAARGDRYLRDVDPHEQGDLYRCGSVLAGGVPMASSSDAPYGPTDPWQAIDAAIHRQTASGAPLGPDERIAAYRALQLYFGKPDDPGGPARDVSVGAPADLCLLTEPLAKALDQPRAEVVRATIIAGNVVYRA